MRAAKKILRRQSGIALLTTILLMLLMSSLLVGFILLINSGQKLSGINNDYGKAFYAAEAGMEKLTADLGTLFSNNYAPPATQINALQNVPPVIQDVTYTTATGASGYTITSTNPTDANGNYLPTVTTISSGAYQGLTALATPYTMSVTARTASGSEVKLQRTTQTVGIPLFQFGIFCQTDCAFYAGGAFNFGGRTHSNGNLFLASGATLTLGAPVTAYKDVITATLENGNPYTNGYTGTINVFNGSGTSVLGPTEGSLTGNLGSGPNTSWPTISTGAGSGDFAGNLRNGVGSAFPQYSTGALQLNLGIVTLGNGTTQSIDVIRRPIVGENPTVTQERYYAQASLRVLLSDNPIDISSLPCISAAAPYNLSHLNAGFVATDAITAAIKANLAGHSETFVPLATSGATGGANYSPTDGYWIPNGNQTIQGYIKIEIQTPPYNACNWTDVTAEVLGFGYVGKNANPTTAPLAPTLAPLPTAQIGSLTASAGPPAADTCINGHPLAIVRLERVRDNPSTAGGAAGACAVTTVGATTTIATTLGTDFWPNVLYDTREGLLNFNDPSAVDIGTATKIAYDSMPSMGGVMQYIEVDVKNLSQYLAGTLGGSGHLTYDSQNAPNDYVLYISDRRGNYYATGTPFAGGWPPLSPSLHETGEYGFSDFANPSDQNGCPNNKFDTGEDLDSTGVSYNYGEYPNHTMDTVANLGYGPLANLYANPGNPTVNALAPPPYAGTGANNCGVTDTTNPYKVAGVGAPIWPGTFVIHANEARENPNFFFRRAVKLVNGVDLVDNLNLCPGSVTCGLTIAAENPVYIQGSYNCKGCTTTPPWTTADVGASVVADAITLLSDNWNDVNSFTGPTVAGNTPNMYVLTNRVPVNSYYRAALVGGKGVYFPLPTTTNVTQDYGTDGGAHNFLRYLESWSGFTLSYEGSLVSLYFNRQGIGVYKSAGNVYGVPTRAYTFDNNFLNPSLLPPRTPLFRDVNTTGFTQLLSPAQ